MMYRGGQGGQTMIPGGALGKAKYALSLGRPDEAERICRKRLEKDAGDVGARVVLAQALLQQSQAREAAEEARRAIRAQNTNVDAHLILSSALLQTGGLASRFTGGVPEEAVRAARKAVDLQPKAAKTHVQLAEALVAKKDMVGARAEADIAVKLEPRLAGAHLIRAIVLYSDKDPEGALGAADAALRNERSLTQAELIRANALLDLKRYDDSLAALDAVDRAGPLPGMGNTGALRGRIYYKQRKFGKSYHEFHTLQSLNPRLRVFAPILAGLSMVATGQFGQGAPAAIFGLLAVLILLVLFGLHFIPVVGGWIVAGLILALIGLFSFGAVRQARGSVLAGVPGGRIGGLGLAVVAFAALLLLVLWLGSHTAKHWTLNPGWLTVGGMLALIFSAVILYLFGRFAGQQT
jgi:tetratricopeptide (TPR) repeat protein